MSATLGQTASIEEGLSAGPVASGCGRPGPRRRPVPLRFEYRTTPLHETIDSLLATDQAPLYVVHFTQAQAVAEAQALTSDR